MNETPKTKSGWRIVRRILIGVAILATLIAIFYTEEDWRGKRAWENCKHELEAKGAVLDWNAYIPPPVPDGQNFFKAPNMADWFVRGAKTMTNELYEQLTPESLSRFTTNNPVVLSEWTWQWLLTAKNIAAADSENADLVLKYSSTPSHLHTFVEADVPPDVDETPRTPQSYASPDLNGRISRLLQNVVGTNMIIGVRGEWLLAKSHAEIKPARIILLSGMKPDQDIIAWFTQCFPTNATGGSSPRIHIEPPIGTISPPKTFRVILDSAYSAADYLAWSDQFVPAFDDVREALKRPYAIIPGDYSVPYLMPIPNFVMMRALAQTLAQRAQCDFLLGKPDDALHELTLIHDVCRILEKPPTGKPETLIEAMINVAISGVYVSTIGDGFKLNAWGEPQMDALQKQLKEIKFAPYVVAAFKAEQASLSHTLETTPASKIGELFNVGVFTSGKNNRSIWKKITNPMYLYFKLCPRGWIYQNMVNSVGLVELAYADGVDLKQETISPLSFDKAGRDLTKSLNHRTPFNVWAQIAIPNFTKAWQTTAHTQTLINEAQIACALERYHLANGNYPETLDVLSPQFIAQLPHDIINGQPMRYRRTGDGKFLLYSVGWNETDDGGIDSSEIKNASSQFAVGDWVWKN